MGHGSRNEGGVGTATTTSSSLSVDGRQNVESATTWLLSDSMLRDESPVSNHSTSSTVSVDGAIPSVTASSLAVNGSQTQADAKTVAWKDLPRKDQLTVITLARLSEPLVQTSLQSYMFYQLKWFDPSLPDSVIASQAGILHASFTAAQFVTSMMWGRVADSRQFGRKTVLLIGLSGTMISCLGFGFSTTFWQALFFRSLGGITNGNVGVLRTMISETVWEKKYQSRAFLLLPMTFNVGTIIGPILGGILSDPAGSYPSLFGDIWFFQKFPYATPNILSAVFLFCAMLLVWLLLEETLDLCVDKRDMGLELGHRLKLWLARKRSKGSYSRLPTSDVTTTDIETHPFTHGQQPPIKPQTPRRRYIHRLPFTRIFTPNVISTLTASLLLSLHVGTFNSLWFVFLSTPVYDPSRGAESPSAPPPRLPFLFTGGLGLHPREVGLAMAILGVLGIALQLLVYPSLSARLGTVRSWRIFLLFFPFTYFIAPYLSLVPSSSPPPAPKDGVLVWLAIAGVLCFHVIGRTFALPAQTILVNNCTPHPSVLGTVHGIGQSVSSLSRTVGPFLGGFLYGQGLARGVVGAVFWCLSAVAIGGIVASLFVHEGDGHEIWLEGDEEDDV
ncbi:major facilitator superfamily domain-containing protein [Triangularia verruculosa]|uniref:Major facilitator superfamily domain-containing protein n=1 Tax=Triangularia verruculosa TaxID=2587418 RepID=A0AAN6X7Q7_9PEZI|nr:major facilitator superfamily domain-containing protein [Triangularia verruculosa]